MQLTPLIVRGRVFLQPLRHQLISDHHLIAPFGGNRQLQDIQQLAGITTRETEQRIALLHLDLPLPQEVIFSKGTFQQRLQILLSHWLKDVHLTAGKQRPDNLKRRVFGGRPDQGDRSGLHCAQQRVLLRFTESVNLIDKEDGGSAIKKNDYFSLSQSHHVRP